MKKVEAFIVYESQCVLIKRLFEENCYSQIYCSSDGVAVMCCCIITCIEFLVKCVLWHFGTCKHPFWFVYVETPLKQYIGVWVVQTCLPPVSGSSIKGAAILSISAELTEWRLSVDLWNMRLWFFGVKLKEWPLGYKTRRFLLFSCHCDCLYRWNCGVKLAVYVCTCILYINLHCTYWTFVRINLICYSINSGHFIYCSVGH